MSEMQHYDIEDEADVLVIVARTSVAHASEIDLGDDRNWLVARFTQSDKPRVVFDFRRVTHFSSSVVNTLINVSNVIETQSGIMAICSLSPFRLEVLAVSGLDSVLNLFPSQAEALAHVRT